MSLIRLGGACKYGTATLQPLAREQRRRPHVVDGRVRRTTSADVARAAGLSPATVSYALNDTPGPKIPAATRERPGEFGVPQQRVGRLQAERLAAAGHRRLGYAAPDDPRVRFFAEPRVEG